MQTITDLIGFLQGAKQAVIEYRTVSNKAKEMAASKSKAESALTAKQREVEENIKENVDKRRAEIEKTYNTEINKSNEELRHANLKRDKAKNQGIKARIKEETAGLHDDIKETRSQIKSIQKRERIPGFCSTGFFRALYFPRKISDFLILIAAFAIAFFVLPWGLWKIKWAPEVMPLVIIYIIAVLLFGGIYVAISRNTVYSHREALDAIGRLMKRIDADNTKIKEITKNIYEDKDENKYDLASFDDEIAHIKQKLYDTTMKKKDALNTFDHVTKNIIIDEINGNAKARIDELTMMKNKATEELKTLEEERSARAMYISDNYETYLGKEYMSVEKIDALLEIAGHGTATNLSELKDEYERKLDE